MHLHDCTDNFTMRYVWTHYTNWKNDQGHTTPQEESTSQERTCLTKPPATVYHPTARAASAEHYVKEYHDRKNHFTYVTELRYSLFFFFCSATRVQGAALWRF